MPRSALHDLKIVECASFVAGPYCSKLLGDMGAEVLKVEPPLGDIARTYGPYPGGRRHPEKSGLFLYLNTSKLGITLDVEAPGERELLLRLICDADVFVHDFSPARARGLGLDFGILNRLNSSLVVTCVTPYGSSGPKADLPGHELNVCQAGGEGYVVPGGLGRRLFPAAPPLRLGGHAGDYDAGVASALATMAALLARDIHGQGQFVDISRQEVNLALNRVTMVTYESEGLVTTRDNRFYKFGGLFPTSDGYVVLRPTEDNHWAALAEIMGRPDLATDPRFSKRQNRISNGDECNALIAEWAATQTKRAIYDRCNAGGCPVGPFNNSQEIVQDPQMEHRGFFKEVDHPVAGRWPYPSAPYSFPGTPWKISRPAPTLGEHNSLVYRERLGLSVDDTPIHKERSS